MDKEKVVQMEEKMATYLDSIMGRKDGLVKVAHAGPAMTNTSYKDYRSSFLTLSDMQIPDDYREIFRWCRYFFKFDPLIGAAVRSLATFPVTDWVLNDTENSDEEDSEGQDDESEEASETYKFYHNILDDLNLYNHMIEIGYDYFLNGNCVIFAEPGVKTIQRRDENGQVYNKKEVVWKSVQRLDLTRLKIDRDPKTHEKIYFYDVPVELKRVIQTQKPKEKYDKIPEIFKKAVNEKKLVKLKSQYVHAFAMPSESGDSGLWGTPPVLHAMKLLLYSNVLRQAQEAIAYEHIIPKRIYFFQETQEWAPGSDFANIAGDFAFELKKQLDDPNYQVISPFPIQQIQHGGQGKALMLVPELEQIQETILAAMGVPREFIFGGVSYSGSTTSLRIVENQFITYRTSLLNYINDFLIKGLAEIRGEWETIDDDKKLVTVTLADLKMQDDIQQKQLMITLNQQGKLPDEVLYEKVLGVDSTKVIKQLQVERIRKVQEQKELQIAQMKAAKELEQEAIVNNVEPTTVPEPTNFPETPEPAPGALEPAMAPEAEGAQAPADQESPAPTGEEPAAQEQNAGNINREALQIAHQMQGLNEAAQANLINKLPQTTAKRAVMLYTQLKAEEENQIDMRPMPEQRPPRRAGGV